MHQRARRDARHRRDPHRPAAAGARPGGLRVLPAEGATAASSSCAVRDTGPGIAAAGAGPHVRAVLLDQGDVGAAAAWACRSRTASCTSTAATSWSTAWPNERTKFRVLLPAPDAGAAEALPPAAPARRAGARARAPVGPRAGGGRRGRSIREFMAELLGGWGLEVVVLADGAAARDAVAADPQRYDLVITDQTMPQLTGLALARELARLRPGAAGDPLHRLRGGPVAAASCARRACCSWCASPSSRRSSSRCSQVIWRGALIQIQQQIRVLRKSAGNPRRASFSPMQSTRREIMDEFLLQDPIGMPRGSLLRIDGGAGVLVHVWEGELWLTQEGSAKDHVLWRRAELPRRPRRRHARARVPAQRGQPVAAGPSARRGASTWRPGAAARTVLYLPQAPARGHAAPVLREPARAPSRQHGILSGRRPVIAV